MPDELDGAIRGRALSDLQMIAEELGDCEREGRPADLGNRHWAYCRSPSPAHGTTRIRGRRNRSEKHQNFSEGVPAGQVRGKCRITSCQFTSFSCTEDLHPERFFLVNIRSESESAGERRRKLALVALAPGLPRGMDKETAARACETCSADIETAVGAIRDAVLTPSSPLGCSTWCPTHSSELHGGGA